jgi:sulfofructose kinase
MRDVDVLCVGATAYDLIFELDRHPLPDEKTTARSLVRCGGGPAANAAVTVARMGLKSAFAGYLGADPFGQFHLDELQAAGVDTGLVVRGDLPTPLSTVWVKPDGSRALVNYRAPGAPLPGGGVDFSRFRPRVVLFDGHEPGISLPLAREARDSGVATLLDAGSLNPGTAALWDQVGFLVCSETFAREFTGQTSSGRALELLAGRHPCVVVTLGEKGLIWARAGQKGRLSAFAVEARDTTGAGDVFHGAFAGCLALGKGWEETLRYASAAAALCCTRVGARTGIPAGDEVERFLREGRQ